MYSQLSSSVFARGRKHRMMQSSGTRTLHLSLSSCCYCRLFRRKPSRTAGRVASFRAHAVAGHNFSKLKSLQAVRKLTRPENGDHSAAAQQRKSTTSASKSATAKALTADNAQARNVAASAVMRASKARSKRQQQQQQRQTSKLDCDLNTQHCSNSRISRDKLKVTFI